MAAKIALLKIYRASALETLFLALAVASFQRWLHGSAILGHGRCRSSRARRLGPESATAGFAALARGFFLPLAG